MFTSAVDKFKQAFESTRVKYRAPPDDLVSYRSKEVAAVADDARLNQ